MAYRFNQLFDATLKLGVPVDCQNLTRQSRCAGA
jgi:hypothetical protein